MIREVVEWVMHARCRPKRNEKDAASPAHVLEGMEIEEQEWQEITTLNPL